MSTAAIPFRPLGLILNTINSVGLNVGHFYDDLVFTEENVVLMKMESPSHNIGVYFNSEADSKAVNALEVKLSTEGALEGLAFIKRGSYQLEQSGKEAVKVIFYED